MALRASELKTGDTYEEVVVEDLKRTQIVQYAGASGDYNPVHTDNLFVTEVAGYPTVFAHGMLTMGLAGKAVTNYVGDGRLTNFGVRFSKQVWPGDTLTTNLTVTEVSTGDVPTVAVDVVTTNADGDVVVKGTATARIDP